jgi:flagellar M-ring protein FliF
MKNLAQQLLAIWRQLGMNQRITIGIAGSAVIAGMVALIVWSHRPQMQLLYGRLTDKDVSEITALLQEQGVKYEVGAGGASLYVPSDQVHKVRMDLASKGVPAGDGVGFEIFDRTNFGISDFVQRTNYTRALQGELSRTISQLHGVRSARVMIVLPENRLLFSDAKSKPTASVFVDAGTGALGQGAVNSIRFLVANSVEGLQADDVAVIDSGGNVLSEDMKDDGAFGQASSQMKLRKSVEDYLSNKVETMLGQVLGPGNAVVRVSAELESDSTTKTQETFDPDGQVLRTEVTTEDTTSTSQSDGEGGTASGPQTGVGVSANIPSNNNGTSALNKTPGKSSEQSRKNHTNSYEINKTTVSAVRAPGTVTGLTAAVFIAAKAEPRKPEEIEALRKMVVNALGVKGDNGKEADRTVTLQEVPFEGQVETKPKLADLMYSNSDLIRNAVACVVAFAVLGVFLGMLKRSKPDAIPIELLRAEPVSGEHSSPVISAEILNDLIRQKPANVGAALRGWMATPNGSSKN